jgi:hypothetical protein
MIKTGARGWRRETPQYEEQPEMSEQPGAQLLAIGRSLISRPSELLSP